jgi:hypothetical protein
MSKNERLCVGVATATSAFILVERHSRNGNRFSFEAIQSICIHATFPRKSPEDHRFSA